MRFAQLAQRKPNSELLAISATFRSSFCEKWVFQKHPDARDLQAARTEDELQNEMASFSRTGKHIRVDSGHLIPLEKPEVVVDAVTRMVSDVKRATDHSTAARTTDSK